MNLKLGILFLVLSIACMIFLVPTIRDDWRNMNIAGDEFFTVGPRFFPYILLVILGVLSAVLTIDSWRRIDSGRVEAHRKVPAHELSRVAISIVIGTAYIVSLPLLGVFVATVACLGGYFVLYGVRHWAWITLFPISIAFAVLLVFEKLMMVPLPKGIWEKF